MIILLDGQVALQHQSSKFIEATQLYLGHAEGNQGYLTFFFNCKTNSLSIAKPNQIKKNDSLLILATTSSAIVLILLIGALFMFYVRHWVLMTVQDIDVEMPKIFNDDSSLASSFQPMADRDLPSTPLTYTAFEDVTNQPIASNYDTEECHIYEEIHEIMYESRFHHFISFLKKYFPLKTNNEDEKLRI